MKKPTIYLDTSIISAFWYEGADVAILARQLRTREWWDLERRKAKIRGGKLKAPVEISELLPRLHPVTEKPRDKYRFYVPKDLQEEAKKLRDGWKQAT